MEATRFYEMAIDAGRHLRTVTANDLSKVHELSSDALFNIGEYGRADHALLAARRAVHADPIRAGELTAKLAAISTRLDAYPKALRRISHALRPLEGRRGREAAATRARLMVLVAATKFLQTRRVESIEWSRRAEREAKRGHARRTLAEAYKYLDLALLENGEIEKTGYSKIGLAIYEELGDLHNQALVLNNLGIIEYDRSNWDAARDYYQRALDLANSFGGRVMAALVKYNISEILNDQGRGDEAEPLLREVVRVWKAAGSLADVAEGNRELAKSLIQRGDLETARHLLDEARAEQVTAGKDGEVLRTDARIAQLLVMAGQSTSALEVIHVATRRAASIDGGSTVTPMLERLRGWALVQDGDAEGAEETWLAMLAAARGRRDRFETALDAGWARDLVWIPGGRGRASGSGARRPDASARHRSAATSAEDHPRPRRASDLIAASGNSARGTGRSPS